MLQRLSLVEAVFSLHTVVDFQFRKGHGKTPKRIYFLHHCVFLPPLCGYICLFLPNRIDGFLRFTCFLCLSKRCAVRYTARLFRRLTPDAFCTTAFCITFSHGNFRITFLRLHPALQSFDALLFCRRAVFFWDDTHAQNAARNCVCCNRMAATVCGSMGKSGHPMLYPHATLLSVAGTGIWSDPLPCQLFQCVVIHFSGNGKRQLIDSDVFGRHGASLQFFHTHGLNFLKYGIPLLL